MIQVYNKMISQKWSLWNSSSIEYLINLRQLNVNNCQTFSDVLFNENITKDIDYSSPQHKHVCQCDPKILLLLIMSSLYFPGIILSNLLIYNALRPILQLIGVHTIYKNTKTRSVHFVYTSAQQSPECRVSSSCKL